VEGGNGRGGAQGGPRPRFRLIQVTSQAIGNRRQT